ncbi:MAG TPA: hypothetical protein VKT77_08420 [Chthonomonadaceae bacterium]|nr:hypothetical protein [Chthonomonadaceae bacterium]
MASWHEITLMRGWLSRYSRDHRTRLVVQRRDLDTFEAFFIRQSVPGMHRPPEVCVQLWPLVPISAPTAQAARELALPLLEVAAAGARDDLFQLRDCPIPIHRKKVATVASPTHRALANIYRHGEARYEIRYFGDLVSCDQEEGWRLSVPPAQGESVPPGHDLVSLADDLASAEQTAATELEVIVAAGEVKLRPTAAAEQGG